MEKDTKEKLWVYLEVPKSFVSEERLSSTTGKTFRSITVPNGVEINGMSLGGYKFTANMVDNPIKNWKTLERDSDPKRMSICFRKDWKVTLTKTEKHGEEYKAVDTKEVDVNDLKKALEENRKRYQEKKVQEEKEQESPQKEPSKPKSR